MDFRTRNSRAFVLVVAFGVATLAPFQLFAAGCGSPGLRIKNGTGRFANALLGAPSGNVDFTARDNLTATNVPSGGASQYVQVPQGGADVTVVDTGTQSRLVPITPVNIEQGKTYTFVAVGIVGAQGASAPRVLSLTDTPVTPDASKSQAALRLVNAGPDSPPVDLYMQVAPATTTTPVLGLTNVSFGNASGYVLVPVGAVTLEVHATGQTAPLSTPTLAQGTVLTAGKIYTVLFIEASHPAGQQPTWDAKVILDD